MNFNTARLTEYEQNLRTKLVNLLHIRETQVQMFKKGQTLAEESQVFYDERLEIERKEKMALEL